MNKKIIIGITMLVSAMVLSYSGGYLFADGVEELEKN